jgi:hypothetical protein
MRVGGRDGEVRDRRAASAEIPGFCSPPRPVVGDALEALARMLARLAARDFLSKEHREGMVLTFCSLYVLMSAS